MSEIIKLKMRGYVFYDQHRLAVDENNRNFKLHRETVRNIQSSICKLQIVLSFLSAVFSAVTRCHQADYVPKR